MSHVVSSNTWQVIATFLLHDNSTLLGFPSKMIPIVQNMDITCTAETHNFPCGVAPFPGAETGAGGRIRDMSATGVGSLVIAGTAGYSVGNLYLPGNKKYFVVSMRDNIQRSR
jgi:phosphoribosylformylglycinamidine (FGAM) synthase-like enzyme